MLGGEPEVGAVGPLVDVAQQTAAAVGPEDEVTHAEDAAPAEGAGEWNGVASGDDAPWCGDAPASTQARQI